MRSRVLIGLAVATFCAAFFASSALAVVVTYYGPSWTLHDYQVEATNGYASRNYNKLFRPQGNYGVVQYETPGGFYDLEDGYQNPVELGPSGAYLLCKCANWQEPWVYPATCNTTKPG